MATRTTKYLHQLTGVSGQALRELCKKGHLPARRPPNGHWRFAEEDLPRIVVMLKEFGLLEPSAKIKTK